MSKYKKGDKFKDDDGEFKITKVPDNDPYDYYVSYYDGRRKPDNIGKNESDIDDAEEI